MPYQHRSTDSLMGDEPEIDALANRAEAMRDIDAEIDRKKERYAMLDSKVVSTASGIVETSLRIISLCTDMARFPLAASPDEVIEIEAHLAHLKTLCREMAK